jgi:hypothetical protein
MTLWRWIPVLRPRHSVHAVLRELIEGLENGSIVLEKNCLEHATRPSASPAQGNEKGDATRLPGLMR